MRSLIITLFLSFFFLTKAQIVYNAYAKVTNISGTTFTVSNLTEPASFSFTVGEDIIFHQTQDDVIGTNTANVATFGDVGNIQSAGLWEQKTLSSIVRSGTNATLTVSSAIVNSYNTGANSSLQIITLKRLSAAAFTTTNDITATAWDGNIGGVVAIEVGTDLTLNNNIFADGLGFRLGSVSNNNGAGCESGLYISNSANKGEKGESIYKRTNANFRYAQANILNGGGGGINHNGGGGGGGNWTAGGQGGPGWNGSAGGCSPSSGGHGGLALSSYSLNRIFMGGGGGGSQQNNSIGSSGANGGGIVIVKANRLITSGACGTPRRISANGNTAPNTTGGFNDAAGGGGAAGTVILQINTFSVVGTCQLNVQANGGDGGSSPFGTTHAGGGAGGQGVVVYSASQPTSNVTTQTNNGNPGCNNNSNPCNNSAGSASGSNGSGVFTNIGGFLPITLIDFEAKYQGNKKVKLSWKTATEINNDYFTLEKSSDGVNFEFLEEIKTKAKHGNSTQAIPYHTIDFSPFIGTTYYKLTQIDKNGVYKSYPIVSVSIEKVNPISLSVYPNPNAGTFSLNYSNVVEEQFQIVIYDNLGKIVFNKTYYNSIQNGNVMLNINGVLANGVYNCVLKSQKEQQSIRMLLK
ncbi:MAG: T9SS type A sorting domain-containing protein [Bacteroidia bacterium]